MFTTILIYVIVLLIVLFVLLTIFIQFGIRWGSMKEEQCASMPGDKFLDGGPKVRVIMTRAVSINATPNVV